MDCMTSKQGLNALSDPIQMPNVFAQDLKVCLAQRLTSLANTALVLLQLTATPLSAAIPGRLTLLEPAASLKLIGAKN